VIRLTRAIEFSASLRERRGDLGDEENRRLFGRRSLRHGHNYRLEVTLRGEPDRLTGMVIDLKHVNDVLEREILERFDHRDLNDDTPFFEKEPPTPENLAALIFGLLREAFTPVELERVRLHAGSDFWVEVSEDTP
jgi:6-pyruvoyltetrahydropterin/6-carboxytetrahydropterin synthase